MSYSELISFPTAKVMKGIHIIGSWEQNIRQLTTGEFELEIRCAIYSYIYKKNPKYISDIMSDDITSMGISLMRKIEILVNELVNMNLN